MYTCPSLILECKPHCFIYALRYCTQRFRFPDFMQQYLNV